MHTAVLTMLIVITLGVWSTWLISLQRNWGMNRGLPLVIATIVITGITIGYGTHFGLS